MDACNSEPYRLIVLHELRKGGKLPVVLPADMLRWSLCFIDCSAFVVCSALAGRSINDGKQWHGSLIFAARFRQRLHASA
jgi:hypothetical protein